MQKKTREKKIRKAVLISERTAFFLTISWLARHGSACYDKINVSIKLSEVGR